MAPSIFFQGNMAKPLRKWFRHGRDCRLSDKSMLENFPAYLQTREELNSPMFEELHKQTFKKDLNVYKLCRTMVKYLRISASYLMKCIYKSVRSIFEVRIHKGIVCFMIL